ncbi:unnamed protein product [Spirodela intermedia]|uniref:Uncharacterized protein n=1 Tax=Spirodela intermedia TaxID=51605 RepID=A0A7I8K3M0_SPIIN|nr:unnamed protein product [Spirodela intermedia]
MVIPPWWWKPNSSSALRSRSTNSGWLKKITGTRTRRGGSKSFPATYTGRWPFGGAFLCCC